MRTRSWCVALLLVAAVWGPVRSAPAVASPSEQARVVLSEVSAELVQRQSELGKAAAEEEAGSLDLRFVIRE